MNTGKDVSENVDIINFGQFYYGENGDSVDFGGSKH